MIKRALGLWAGELAGGGGDIDDSDEELPEEDRQKLERRLPGAMSAKKTAKKIAASKVESDDDDDASGSGAEGGWASEDPSTCEDSDEDPVMPPEKVQDKDHGRGKFHCQLCPDKVLLNEKLLEAHMQSSGHKKNEARFEEAKALGAEAYEAKCRERMKAREALTKDGARSKRKDKNETYWEKKMQDRRDRKKKAAKGNGEEGPSELSQEKIDARKARFQAKKVRRLQQREAGKAGEPEKAAEPKASAEPAEGNRKARRREVQEQQAAPAPAAAEGNPRRDGKQNRKERRLALQAAYATSGKNGSTEPERLPKKKKKKNAEA